MMLPTKLQVYWPFGSEEEKWLSWISDASFQVSSQNWPFGSGGEAKNKFSDGGNLGFLIERF